MYLKTLSMSAQFQSSFPHFRLFVNSPNTDPLIRAQIPLRRTLSSWCNYTSRAPSPNTMTYEFAWIWAHSVKSNSLQPHGLQPTRLLCPWDSPGKNTGVGCISFSNAWKWKVKVKSLSWVRLLATPWTTAHQAPLSMGFSRQEYWNGLPFPTPRDLLNSGM